jgi:hypothetical protein
VVSEQILQNLITEVLKDIITILECETTGQDGFPMGHNQMLANEGIPMGINYQPNYDPTAFGRYDNSPGSMSRARGDEMMKYEKKGIRVNFNAIKEYLSLVLNYIKGIFIRKSNQLQQTVLKKSWIRSTALTGSRPTRNSQYSTKAWTRTLAA